jgi:transcriptional regulator of acetoin/glycerol metabolism
MLVDSFLQRGGQMKQRISVEPAAMARMQGHDWPGNIRELRNVLDRARLYADDGVVRDEHLPEHLGRGVSTPVRRAPPSEAAPADSPGVPADLTGIVATFNGTRRELADHLGLSERTLYRRLKALGLA